MTKMVNPNHPVIEGTPPDYYEQLSNLRRALSHPDIHAHLLRTMGPKTAIDINAIMALVAQLPALLPVFAALIAAFNALKPAPKPTPVPTPAPTPTPTPTPTPVPTPVPDARTIASLSSHWLGAEGWAPSKGHFPVAFDPSRDVAGAGYRMHADTTPKDQNSQPFYNSDLQRYPLLFAKNGNVYQDTTGKWTAGEGNNRTYFRLRLDGRVYGPQGDMKPGQTPFDDQNVVALTSETDDGSFTPVWVISQDLAVDEEHTLSFQQVDVLPNGTEVEGNWAPDIRIHVWGF